MQKVNIWQDGIIPGWLRGVGRLCLLTCAIIRTELDKEASWKETSCDHSTVIRTGKNLAWVAGIYWNYPHRNMVGLYPLDLGQSTKETQKGSLGNRKDDCRFGLNDHHFKLMKEIRVVPPLHRQFLSLQWFALMLTPHCVIPTQLGTRRSLPSPRSPMITSDMAATSPFCIKGSMRMLTAEGWVWKERASGNTVPWEFLLGQSYRYQNVPQDSFIFWWKWEYSIIPAADFPWEVKLALSFAHLVTLHHTLLFIPNSSPWCGIDSCAVVLPSGTFFTFFFFFCCGSVFLFANCLFSRIFPCPPCLLSFIFLPRKTWLRYQKKMKLQKLKFKKKKT